MFFFLKHFFKNNNSGALKGLKTWVGIVAAEESQREEPLSAVKVWKVGKS